MKRDEIAKHFFVRNPELQEIHITGDGQGFHEKHQAEAHSQRQKDQTVESFDRDSIMKEALKSKVRALTNPPATAEQKAKEEAEAAEQKAKEEAEAAEKAAAEQKAKDVEVIDEKEVKTFSFLEENVGPASEAIKKIESVEELDAIAAAEKAGEDRTGVRNAIEARRAQLTESNTQKTE